MTVPLYFERQISKDSGAIEKLPHFDFKIRNIKWSIIASQTLLLVFGLSFTLQISCQWIKSINGQWNSFALYQWSGDYNSLGDFKKLLAVGTCLNLISLSAIFAGLLFVKKWMKDAFEGERRWRCSADGNFLVYFILLITLTLVQVALMIFIFRIDPITYYYKIINWNTGKIDDFFSIFVAILIFNLLNFFMSMFAVYMLVKMSRAKWSIRNNDSK